MKRTCCFRKLLLFLFLTLQAFSGEFCLAPLSSAGNRSALKLRLSGDRLFLAMESVLDQKRPRKDLFQYLQILEAGIDVLSGYEPYLNAAGRRTLASLKNFRQELDQGLPMNSSRFSDFKKLLWSIPTVSNPNEELFIEVMEGWTDEQLSLLGINGDEASLVLELNACRTNPCLICGFGQSGKACSVSAMPFPIAVKIMKKVRDRKPGIKKLTPYFNSDPFLYEDPVIGADLSHIVAQAKELGFSNVELITHGVQNRDIPASKIEAIAKKTSKEGLFLLVSLHSFERKEIPLLIKARREGHLSDNEFREREEALAAECVEQFIPLIRGCLSGKGDFALRVLKKNKRDDPILEKYPEVLETLEEFEAIQEIILQMILEHPFFRNEKERKGKTLSDFQNFLKERMFEDDLGWINDGARFLSDMGVSESDISLLQKNKVWMIPGEGVLYIRRDGTLNLALKNYHGKPLRKIGQMAPGPESPEFEVILELLKVMILHKENSTGKLTDEQRNETLAGCLARLESQVWGRAYTENEKQIVDHAKYVVFSDMESMIREIFFHFTPPSLQALILKSNPEDLPVLYEKLKSFPLPTSFRLQIGDFHGNLCIVHYDFNPGILSGKEKDVFNSTRFYEIENFQAFSLPEFSRLFSLRIRKGDASA